MMRMTTVLSICLVLGGTSARATAPEGRGFAMGGAYSSLAAGAEGLFYNAATLGAPLLGSVMGGVTLEAGNNALTLTQMRSIVMGTDADKAKAADAIDKEGSWDARIEAVGGVAASVMGVGVSYGRHAVVAAEEVSPLLARIGITGKAVPLTANTTYTLKGTTSLSTYDDIAVGYAHSLPSLIPGTSLSAGAAVRYFKGSAYDSYHEDDSFTTGLTPPAFNGAEYYKSTTGTGLGFDLGVEASLLGSVKAALVARNLGASIKWTDGTLLKTNPTSLAQVTTTGEKRAQTLPSTIALAGSASIPVVGTSVSAAVEQQTGPALTRVRLGAEQSIFGILSFRGGLVTAAGPQPMMINFGLGIGAIIARVDAGAAISPGGKGGGLSLSGTVKF